MSDPRERIKKLLALGRNSSSRNETRNARKQASILMNRYGLNRKEVYQPTIPLPRPIYTGVDLLAETLKQAQVMEELKRARRERRNRERKQIITLFCVTTIWFGFISYVLYWNLNHG